MFRDPIRVEEEQTVTNQSPRDVLPIPDEPYEGKLPLDAKDPAATFPHVTAAISGLHLVVDGVCHRDF